MRQLSVAMEKQLNWTRNGAFVYSLVHFQDWKSPMFLWNDNLLPICIPGIEHGMLRIKNTYSGKEDESPTVKVGMHYALYYINFGLRKLPAE